MRYFELAARVVAHRSEAAGLPCQPRRLGLVDKPIRSQQKLLHFVLSVP